MEEKRRQYDRREGSTMLRVFLVEDESTIREALRDTVPWNQVGYEFVGEAGDGEMALPLLRQVSGPEFLCILLPPLWGRIANTKRRRGQAPALQRCADGPFII